MDERLVSFPKKSRLVTFRKEQRKRRRGESRLEFCTKVLPVLFHQEFSQSTTDIPLFYSLLELKV